MKTWNAKTDETDRQWFVVDAAGLRLGRLATHVANILRGKNVPTFTPNADVGGFVVVINSGLTNILTVLRNYQGSSQNNPLIDN